MRTLRWISLATILLYSGSLTAAEIPFLTGRVNDNAQILSPETSQTLTEKLRIHEEQTTNQVAILTIPTLDGDNIEDYANRVFGEWKLGTEEKDNGILILVVPNDRQMRIEVGYGLEGTLTDLQAGRIIRDIMAPFFKQGDYNGGITAGTEAVLMILNGGEVFPAEGSGEESGFLSDLEDFDLPLLDRILIGVFVFGIIGIFTLLGILTPGFGWFLYFFLMPFWAMFPIIVLGTKGTMFLFAAYVVLFPLTKLLLKRTEWYKRVSKKIGTKGGGFTGGMTFGSGGSGSSWMSSGGSSWGGSSGGFSGGGGSSGGGGASGGW